MTGFIGPGSEGGLHQYVFLYVNDAMLTLAKDLPFDAVEELMLSDS